MGVTQQAEQEIEPVNINSLPSSLLYAVFAHLGAKGGLSGAWPSSNGLPLDLTYLRWLQLHICHHRPCFVAADLCSVSATCVLWSKLTKDRASNKIWKRFYTSRWRVTEAPGDEVCWQSKYGSKMKQVTSGARVPAAH